MREMPRLGQASNVDDHGAQHAIAVDELNTFVLDSQAIIRANQPMAIRTCIEGLFFSIISDTVKIGVHGEGVCPRLFLGQADVGNEV